MAKIGDICMVVHTHPLNANRVCEVIEAYTGDEYPHVVRPWVVRILQSFYSGSLCRDVPAGVCGVIADKSLIPLPGLPADESERTDQPIPAEVA